MIRLFKTEAGAKRRASTFPFRVKVIRYMGVYVICGGRSDFKGIHHYLNTHNRWTTGRLSDLVYIGLPGVTLQSWTVRSHHKKPCQVREDQATYYANRIETRLVGTTYGAEGRPTHHVGVFRKDGTARLYAGTINITDHRDPTFNPWGTLTLSPEEKQAALNSHLVKAINR